ncbi:MAG: cation:proton antiporter [Flavobacteriaceae bacterium]|nr:cation:proton antiporter [Flavobacteriaceae bacterium]
MKDYFLILLGFGAATVLMAYIPIFAEKLKITFTLPVLILGVLLFYIGIPINWPEPLWDNEWVKIITELIVVISLMGAGLKIGFRYSREHWRKPLKLIHTTMPLYILGIFILAYYLLGLDGPVSLLLAAVCAPTDPVMATEMQIEDKGEAKDKNTGLRYLLTAEAGLNDGMAFPFVFLAILWSKASNFSQIDFSEWVFFYLIYKIVIGIIIGSVLGYLYSLSIDNIDTKKYNKILSGFVAIALAITSFALAEMASGYGFLSAFFTGLFAQYHNHKYNRDHSKTEMVIFTQEMEKVLVVLWTLLFGGFIASGILGYTDIWGIVLALAIILVLRPLAGILGMFKTDYTKKKKWAVAFFGIKGIGSFFYLSFAFTEQSFNSSLELYAIVSWVVLFSIVIHGLTGPRVISYFEKHNPG